MPTLILPSFDKFDFPLFLPFHFCLFCFPFLYNSRGRLHACYHQWAHPGPAEQHGTPIPKYGTCRWRTVVWGGRGWSTEHLGQHTTRGAVSLMPPHSHCGALLFHRKKCRSVYPDGRMLKRWGSQSSWGLLTLIKVQPGGFFCFVFCFFKQ